MPAMNEILVRVSQDSIARFFLQRHGGDPARFSGYNRICWQRRYFSPGIVYESTVDRLLAPGSAWIDVGGGREVIPGNPGLARTLAGRCSLLVSVDPSENVLENDYAHEKHQALLEDYHTERTFDLATMRMVVEHVENPGLFVSSLKRLLRPGGRALVYTVYKYSPASVVAALTPMSVHHAVKRVLWGTEERDSFPVHYRMNTRSALLNVFQQQGFQLESFSYLDDCRSFARWPLAFNAEILTSKLLRAAGLRYPESCLLAVFVRGRD